MKPDSIAKVADYDIKRDPGEMMMKMTAKKTTAKKSSKGTSKGKYVLHFTYHNYSEGTEESFADGAYPTLDEAQKAMWSKFAEIVDEVRENNCEDEDYDANMTDDEVAEKYLWEYEHDDMSFHANVGGDYSWDYKIQLA